SLFYFDFLNLQNDIEFVLKSGKYSAGPFDLKVIPKPLIINFEIDLNYPAYLNKHDEKIENNGDFIIPEGTEVTWKFFTTNTNSIKMRFNEDNIKILETAGSNSFVERGIYHKSFRYSVISRNQFMKNKDSLFFQATVIPDLFPSIIVEEYRDSTFFRDLFFKGVVRDDHGFNKLLYHHKVKTVNDIISSSETSAIAINGGMNPQQFFHHIDITEYNLNPGETIEYYFEIWDNDGVNGSKSTRSQTMVFRAPDLEEIEKETEEKNELLKTEMEENINEAQDLQKEIEELNKKLIEKNELSWEDKQQIQSLVEKVENLKNQVENIKKENELKALKEEQFKEINPEILEKQKQLEELLNELLEDEELKKLFEELQELMEEVDKNKVNEMLEKMKMSSEELEEILDRNLELFKQLEFEKKLDESIRKLNELAEKQKELAEKTENKEIGTEESEKEQEKLNKEFEKIREDLNEAEKMNSELDSPNEFDKMEEQQEEISEEMEESMEMLQKNSRKKASQSQQDSGEQMQQLADDLQEMQQEMLEEGMMEDINAMRDLLENLIQASFDQEALIDKVKAVNINDPQYNDLMKEQKRIQDDMEMVKDSLSALSKRNIMIEPYVSKELKSIDKNLDATIGFLNQRRTANAAARQQHVMTSLNNLALMLSESLNQMQQSMQNQMKSGQGACKSKCNKPGSGQSVKSMRQLQQQIGKQIEGLKKGMKSGGNSNSKKPGRNSQMSEKLARLAAEQEALRNQLGEYADQLEKEGELKQSGDLKRIMEEMEKNETDLVNKMITQETLLRQQNILTRLLKSEKAEMEREKEEKRESNEAKNMFRSNPEDFFEYKRLKSNEVELLKTIPPQLKPYYKEKVNQYFDHFEK
ncbi:MAG: hypothetical protein K8R53_14835, partial [Bacteroidales bacterium]|nr:hypothetical protein [Bacteroidales bacterium]